MSKHYSFEFPGTKEMFLNQLNKYPNNDEKFFYFDDYIVDLSNGDIRFGVARGGHSSGYWFIPTITEIDSKTTLSGTLAYISPHTGEKGIQKTIYKIEQLLLWIILFPVIVLVIVLVKIYLFFSWIVRKIYKRTKPKEKSPEDKLYHLMENLLGCTRQEQQ